MEEPTIFPIGTKCFFKGKLYSITQLIYSPKKTEPIYIIETKEGRKAFTLREQLILPMDIDNASAYKYILREVGVL